MIDVRNVADHIRWSVSDAVAFMLGFFFSGALFVRAASLTEGTFEADSAGRGSA